GGGRRVFRVPPAQQPRPCPNAVDAEKVVESRADERHQQADRDPAKRGLRPALVLQRVHRGGDAEDGRESRERRIHPLRAHAPSLALAASGAVVRILLNDLSEGSNTASGGTADAAATQRGRRK